MTETYSIRVRGHLADRWSDELGGLAVQLHDDGTTALVGPIVDQAALHGVLARIRDLGLPLLAVDRVAEPSATTTRQPTIATTEGALRCD